VASAYYNAKGNIMVYALDNKINTSEKIYEQGIIPSGIKAKRYIVSNADLKNGCPVIEESSFYGKLTQFVSNIVN